MKILVCTDGSAGSFAILPHAGRFARATGAEVAIVRVIDPRVDAAAEVAPRLGDAVTRVKEAWKAELEKALSDSDLQGSVVIPEREWGKEIAESIHLAADRAQAAMIAISSRGAGAIRHALLGSVALGVITRADLPVMTMAGSHPVREGSGPYHIVVTSDGSPDSRSIFAGLAGVLVPGKTKVTILEVVTMQAMETEAEAKARVLPYLESLLSRLPAGVEAAVDAVAAPSGSKIDVVIAQRAQELGADAIASATHGHSARRHLVAGSTALGVLEKSGLPVILVKSKAVE